MLKKISVKEIIEIKGRIKSELKIGDLTFHRKTEIESLLYRLDCWLKWKERYNKKRYKERIESEN